MLPALPDGLRRIPIPRAAARTIAEHFATYQAAEQTLSLIVHATLAAMDKPEPVEFLGTEVTEESSALIVRNIPAPAPALVRSGTRAENRSRGAKPRR